MQSALESGQEDRIDQIDFIAAFDKVRELSISSVLWILEVLRSLYGNSFYQIDHSTLWWTLFG